jgi:hypothetical protein
MVKINQTLAKKVSMLDVQEQIHDSQIKVQVTEHSHGKDLKRQRILE